MNLELDNTHAKVTLGTVEEKEWLADYLSFDTMDWRTKSMKRTRLYSVAAERFPSGFLQPVLKRAATDGISVEVLDVRPPAVQRDPNADLGWLRDYQRDAVEAAFTKERGIIWVPTGGGKTELAVALARAIQGRWLFLVHRVSLLQQTMDRFKLRTGEDAGIVGDGTWMPKRFTVTTFQTLMRKLGTPEGRALIESVDGVIVDEAHSTPAETYYRVVQSIRNARYRIGLSGTPLARGDKKSVYTVGALGPVIYRIRPELLIERGVLSRPKIHLIHVDHSQSNFAWDARWQDIYKEGVTENDKRNVLIVEAVKQTPKPALVFVQHVDHGHRLMRLIHKAGMNAEFVYGNASLEQRQASIKRLVRGDIDVLICSVIFQEGVDIPALQSVVIATGGASSIAAIQRVGRGMRMAEGKDSFTVWDVADRGHRWFEKHTKQRIRAYRREGYEVIGEQTEIEE